MSCIFCQILDGKIPSYSVYEDDYVYAFLDITQGTKGHTLVIPKRHVHNLYEVDEDIAKTLFTAVPKVARALKRAFNPIGMNLINNNDKPHQTVFHFHLHLIPRYPDDGMQLSTLNHQDTLTQSDFVEIQKAIKDAFE